MARPTGSKVIECDCGSRLVGLPGTTVTCKMCGKKTRFTKKLLKELGKIK